MTETTAIAPTELLIEVPCDSGEIAIVQPFSPLAYQELLRQVDQLFPLPDKTQYATPLPNAFAEGMTIPAEQNTKYLEALKRVIQKQKDWLYVAVVEAGVVIDTKAGRIATMERFLSQLAALNKRFPVGDDQWLATVKYGVIRTPLDVDRIVKAARGTLTEEELNTAFRSFRREI